MDRALSPFLNLPCSGPTLRQAREAMYISKATVADRLGISRQAYGKLEDNDSISLATLRRHAEALDCEVVVAVRPKHGLVFSDLVWRDLVSVVPSLNLLQLGEYQMRNRHRLRRGWTRNTRPKLKPWWEKD